MSYEQARTDIATVVQAIKTAWASYTLNVEMDNRNSIDYSTQTDPFLQVETVYISGEQLDMGDSPKVAQYGQIILSAVSKDGTGSVNGIALLDFVIPYFEMKDFTCIRTRAAEPQAARLANGWYYQPVIINFWFIR